MKQRKVIHLEYNGEHYYFGSLKAMCDAFGQERLGMTYSSIRNLGISPEKPFKHSRLGYIIIEGVLISAYSSEKN